MENFAKFLVNCGIKDNASEKVTRDDLENFFSSALCGSGWCGVDNSRPEWSDPANADPTFEGKMATIILNGGTVRLYDIEDEDDWVLSAETLDKGFADAGKFSVIARNVVEDEGWDMMTADAALQTALMGEIVYG